MLVIFGLCPNINGSLVLEHLTISAWNGAFLKSDNSTAANVGRDFEGYGRVVTFTANRSNSIYGASNTVAPNSLIPLIIIKI